MVNLTTATTTITDTANALELRTKIVLSLRETQSRRTAVACLLRYPCRCSELEDPRDHPVPHLLAVLRPVMAVLLAALDVVAEGPVHEQQREPDEVGIHHDVRK